MMPKIIRPGAELPEEKRKEIAEYCHAQWLRAESSRREQVDGSYAAWDKAYYGIPLEEVRTVPFYKASNFVVKLIRMFLDTFVARTQNIIFATKPLFVIDVLPKDLREAAQLYINRKALYDWNYYKLIRDLCFRGNKNGTVVTKTIYEEKSTWDVMPGEGGLGMKEEKYIFYSGPSTYVIPFEDFYLYPATANTLEEADILFHKVRYSRAKAEQLLAEGGPWRIPAEKNLDDYLVLPQDVKRTESQSDEGVRDSLYQELALVECHLQYAITNDSSKYYSVAVLIHPTSGDCFDLYYNPYPRNICLFNEYRPYPREELFYGESMCQLLGQAQEESSRIHNERRDNSMLANTMCFKRRSGSLIPNPSTNWYPGKVWDLEDMSDLETFDIGRNYNSTIDEEQYVMQLTEKLSGIGPVMQGQSQGSSGKGGTYNTMGTLAVMSEGNQRQDTNIRDVRESASGIIRTALKLQATYGSDDSLIEVFPAEEIPKIKAALAFFASDKYKHAKLEIKSSDAGANKQVERMNLLQIATVINQYGQQTMQMAQQLLQPDLNPGLREIMNSQINMMRSMATTIVKEFDEFELAEEVPDVVKSIAKYLASSGGGAQGGGSPQQPSQPGRPNNALPPVQKSGGSSAPPPGQTPGGPPQPGGMAA